uniref:Aspartate racemase n=1 Tax=Quercus lobata TaxID=97700 RepID=A0A7N2L1I6_QUELO
MTILFHILNCPPVLLGRVSMNKTPYRRRSNLSVAVQISSVSIQTDDSENLIESKKILGSGMALKRSQTPNSLLRQPNTIGVIGGVSVYSTLIFLEKLVRWSSKDGQECVPFVVCSDPALSKELPVLSSFHSVNDRNAQTQFNHGHIVRDLQQKRLFLEQSGACCIVMPCHLSHVWHSEVSKGCSLPFLHVGDCVAMELSKADLRPLEAGSNVRIGVLATGATLKAGVYQEKLQSQGFEVVLPDQATMHHIILPAIEAFYRRDITGARNLLRIAVQVLLVRAVNTVILASDEMQGLLPHDDPLLKKCIDPMDALARSTIRWATSTEKVNQKA